MISIIVINRPGWSCRMLGSGRISQLVMGVFSGELWGTSAAAAAAADASSPDARAIDKKWQERDLSVGLLRQARNNKLLSALTANSSAWKWQLHSDESSLRAESD